MTRAGAAGHRATELFGQGFSCAESVLAGAGAVLGVRSSLLPRIATGFGSGISRQGLLCGALAGAIMVLGARQGRSRPDASRDPCYRRVQLLMRGFEREFGAVACEALTGCRMSSARDRARAARAGVFRTRCPGFVAWAAAECVRLDR
jgi:C_GCAxxG_C_C family probable redox protein